MSGPEVRVHEAEKGKAGSTRWPVAIATAGLFAMVLLAYWPATQAGFIWDDDANVTLNRPLRSAAGLARLWLEPGATTQYYPLVYTTFWLEYAAFELDPLGYHVTNLLLHALAAILLWRCLLALGVRGAWVAAGVFALHPLQVETVAWITERKNLLSFVFYLASALCFLKSVGRARLREPDTKAQKEASGILDPSTAIGPSRRSSLDPLRYAASLVFFLGALLSKVTAVTLPPALLVIAWWQRERQPRRWSG